MAIAIDDLQVDTQGNESANAPRSAGAGGKPQPKPDLKREMDKLRERELRLRAD
jgi:hypothetical protein